MTDRDALLAAMIADPDDDLPRLVYADWLEEHGATDADRARAAFIRLQIEADRLAEGDGRRAALRAESGRLRIEHYREWTRAYPAAGLYYRAEAYRRGFIDGATLDAAALADPALDALLAAEPVTRLVIDRFGVPPDRLAAWPHLSRVRELTVRGCDGVLAAVLRSPRLGGLRSLEVWPGSRTLDPAEVALVAALPALRELDLGGQLVGDDGAATLARCPAGLATLRLSGNALGPRGVRALAESPRLAGVGVLDLSGNPAGADWLPALLAGRWRPHDLGLRGNDLGWDEVVSLAESPLLAGVRRLSLAGNPLGPTGVAALVRSPHLADLRELDLAECGIGDAGASVLADPAALPGLVVLRTSDYDYDPDAAEALYGRFGYDPADCDYS